MDQVQQQEQKLQQQVKELRELLDKGDTALRTIKENAMIFYGTTGSGKSTLTSGCSGRVLMSIKNEWDELEIQIQDQRPEEKGITKIPVALSKEYPNGQIKNIYDTTGFNDIGGYPQEIANAFYNKRLIEITEQMKFVLVVDQYQITQSNGIGFITAVNNFSAMFKNIELLQNGVAICISKVDRQFQIEFWQQRIDIIRNLSEKLTPQSRSVIEYTYNKLFIFRAPQDEGQQINCDDLFDQIDSSLEYINNTGDNKNNLFNIAISEEAKAPAKNLFEESLNIFQNSLQYVAQKTQDKCNEINAPENAEKIVKEVIRYRREILKKDYFLFEYDKEVIVEEKVLEYSTRYKQVLDLDDMMTLRDLHDTVLGEEVTITQMQKCIESMFRIFEKNTRDDQQKQELEINQKNILQNLQFVRFLSQVCETVTIQLDQIKEKFRATQQSLKDAEKKGIDDIKVLPDGKSYQYYQKNFMFLNREPYKSQRQHMNKMAYTQFCMGKIQFDEKEYDTCAKHFKEAIMLSENKDCQLFTDIYECISNIFYYKKDSMKIFQDQIIHQKLFAIYKKRFDENLDKFSMILDQIGSKNNIGKFKSKLKYLESINEIRIQLSKLSPLKNIDTQFQQIIESFKILHQLVLQKFENLKLVLGGEEDSTDKSKKAIDKIFQKFENDLNAQIFVNSLQKKEFQTQIEDWFSKINSAYTNIKQNQRDVTREIEIIDKDLEMIIKFSKYLKNDRHSKEILSQALFKKGIIKRQEGQKKFEQAINFFKDALEVNKQKYEAKRYIADCYFDLKRYTEAIEFYKQIHQNEKVLECFDLQKKENGNTVKLAKDKAKFYQEIGLYEKAKEVLTMEAISIISNSIDSFQIQESNEKILEIENEIRQIANPQNQPQVSFVLQQQEQEIFSEEFVDQ